MKIVFSLFICLFIAEVSGQSQVTLTIDTRFPGHLIPDDFCGLSFGAIAEMPQKGGTLIFSPTNSQLITLFTNCGIRNLRLGGSTVEGLKGVHPSHAAIDSVFGFAKVAGVKIIYSLPLLNGDPARDADTAKYIWDNYRVWLDCFAIGNEPDIKRYHYPPFGSGTDPIITNYSSYLSDWRKFAAAVTDAVPEAKFAGPDAANSGKRGGGWASQFITDEKQSGIVVLATQHFYVGGSPFITNGDDPQLIPVPEAIDKMLSPGYITQKYPSLYDEALFPVASQGMPYRMTESDDCLKGVPDASDAFASALWGLDYLHWWAAHGASGVNFHNTEWLKTDTVYFDAASGNYLINPKAYSIRAFDLGSHGNVHKVAIANKKNLNLTAYAVSDTTNLYVTIINKEHGLSGRSASVTIISNGFLPGRARAMFLTAPNNDVNAKSGIELGGMSIVNNKEWFGQWHPLNLKQSNCRVIVPFASAAVIEISRN